MKRTDIPMKIIEEYKLNGLVELDGSIFIEVLWSMYGLPQSGLLSNELLEKDSTTMVISKANLSLAWKHEWQPVQFTLVVGNFGVKYVGKEHSEHLQAVIAKYYKMSTNWTGRRYIGITLNSDTRTKRCIC